MSDKAKTVKVRIAVSVDLNGQWSCFGHSSMNEEDAHEFVAEGGAEGEARYWLTAELAIPSIAEVPAEVEKT